MRSEETKRIMIDAAKSFIRENQNLTIKDIAETCFVNIAAVNYHFGSKDNLIALATNEILDTFRADIQTAMAELDDDDMASFEHYLERVVDAAVLFAVNNPGAMKHIVTNLPSLIRFSKVFLESIPDRKVHAFARLVNTEASDSDIGIFAQLNKEMFVTAAIAPVIIRLVETSNTVDANLFHDPEFRARYAKAVMRGFEAVCKSVI
jgi:TetR/AcrR family transcriptional regulator, regulator of cefoperazone and chloramphenicol sensitivity